MEYEQDDNTGRGLYSLAAGRGHRRTHTQCVSRCCRRPSGRLLRNEAATMYDHGIGCRYSRDTAGNRQGGAGQGPGADQVLTVESILDSRTCGVDLARTPWRWGPVVRATQNILNKLGQESPVRVVDGGGGKTMGYVSSCLAGPSRHGDTSKLSTPVATRPSSESPPDWSLRSIIAAFVVNRLVEDGQKHRPRYLWPQRTA